MIHISTAGSHLQHHHRPEHAVVVLEIYQLDIDKGQAKFETTASTWEAFDAAKLPDHRHVALDPGERVLGWTAATAVSDRCVYAGVVEHSLYVAPTARGRGVGTALLQALIASTKAAGISTTSPGSSPRIPPASPCTVVPDSARSAPANASDNTTTCS